MLWRWLLSISAAMILGVAPIHAGENALTLLNVSYDPTRELYQDLNAAFGPSRDHAPVTRRLREAGPLGDRWLAGRCGHPGPGL